MTLQQSIEAAWKRREALHAAPALDAYRVFHGWDEGEAGPEPRLEPGPEPGPESGLEPGLEIDRYGDVLTIELRARHRDRLPEIVAALDACRRFDCIVARPRGDRPFALRGAPAEHVVQEHGLRFLVDPLRPGNPGLFLDARPARAWVRANSHGRRVLNLFAFTGSLGVAAAAGGALSVVHADSARSALDACGRNHALNELPIDARGLARMNIYQHLRRQAAGRQRLDGIIVDPPPLTGPALRSDRSPGGRGVIALAPLVARMLAPGGWMLCFFHHAPRDREALEAAVLDAAGVRLDVLWRGESGPDFPESDPHRKLRLTAFVRAA